MPSLDFKTNFKKVFVRKNVPVNGTVCLICFSLAAFFFTDKVLCMLASSSVEPAAEALAVGDPAHIYDSWRERDMQIVAWSDERIPIETT